MARTHSSVSISLPPQLKKFLDDVVDEGNYGSVSAVMHDALRLFQREREQYELKSAYLREALAEAVAQVAAGERGVSLQQFRAERKARRKADLKRRIQELQEELDAA